MPDSSRRLFLRVGVKLMFLLAIAASGYVLFSPAERPETTPPEQLPPLRVKLTDIPPDTLQRLPRAGGNLILIRHSNPSDTPEREGIYVAFDRGGGLGCPLQWIPPATRVDGAPLKPWPGGLRDSCDGSWYDATGHVFEGQSTTRDLVSPTYRLIGELLEIGTSGDNPAPAN